YHRLVLELFFVAAYALRSESPGITPAYRDRLVAMARFVAAYSRRDGSSPLWGDADDARVLPFGGQALSDHRYLIGLVALLVDDEGLQRLASGSEEEAYWWFGPKRTGKLAHETAPLASQAFPQGGVFVMRNAEDHVFIDCGPI